MGLLCAVYLKSTFRNDTEKKETVINVINVKLKITLTVIYIYIYNVMLMITLFKIKKTSIYAILIHTQKMH